MKYAIVTGCASGIGKSVAFKLYEKGVYVFGFDISKCNYKFKTFVCDVSDEIQVKKCIANILETTDKIDYLVNCAGMLTIGKPIYLKEIPLKLWEAIFRINVQSSLIMIKESYLLLKKSDNASVLNISSDQTFDNPQIGFAPYIASKTALNTLTKCCAQEFLEDGIRVNAFAFGTVRTNILNSFCDENRVQELFDEKEKQIPYGVMSAVDASKYITTFLENNMNKYMTGEIIRIDGGFHLSR